MRKHGCLSSRATAGPKLTEDKHNPQDADGGSKHQPSNAQRLIVCEGTNEGRGY